MTNPQRIQEGGTTAPERTTKCPWCNDSVATVETENRRYRRLQAHEDIYPRRACEGGGYLVDGTYGVVLKERQLTREIIGRVGVEFITRELKERATAPEP
jgi:hypothetical protein